MIQSGSNAHQIEVTSADHDQSTGSASRRRLFDVRTRATRNVMVVSATGELDAVNAAQFRKAITEALGAPGSALIVDLSELVFLSAAGLGVLQDGHRSAGRSKQFCVVADGSATSRPLRMVGLDRKLRLYPTVDQALNDIPSRSTGWADPEPRLHVSPEPSLPHGEATRFTHDQVAEIVANRAGIEQAKGILMSVYGIDAYQSFNRLRAQARTSEVDIRLFAEQLVNDVSALTPDDRRDMRSACTALLISVHTRLERPAS